MTLWYLARSTGIVALIAFSVATSCGALASVGRQNVSAGATGRRVIVQYVHRGAALTGLALIATHVTTILLDSYAHVPLSAVVIPMASGYRPFAVTLGAVALWSLLVVAGSGAIRRQFARGAGFGRRWRLIHLLSYAAWALAISHALTVGTEVGTSAMTAVLVGCITMVVLATLVRLGRQLSYRRRPLSSIRQRLSPAAVRSRGLR